MHKLMENWCQIIRDTPMSHVWINIDLYRHRPKNRWSILLNTTKIIQKLWVASKWDPHLCWFPTFLRSFLPQVLRRHGLTPWRAWVKSLTQNLDRFLWPMVFAAITKHQLKNIFQVTTVNSSSIVVCVFSFQFNVSLKKCSIPWISPHLNRGTSNAFSAFMLGGAGHCLTRVCLEGKNSSNLAGALI